MLRLDSLKITVKTDAILGINAEHFERKQIEKGGNVVSIKNYIKNPALGVKYVEYNEVLDEISIEMSAKVLRHDYFDLININNIENVITRINNTCPIKLDAQKVVDTAKVRKCDTTTNIKVIHPPALYVDALRTVSNTNYMLKHFSRKGNKGIVFEGKQRSIVERQIYYEKMVEIMKDSELRKVVPYKHLHTHFKDVLRCESNLTTGKRVRQFTGSTALYNVLNSTANVNALLFEKIHKGQVHIDLQFFNEYAGMALYQVEKIEGRKGIIKICNCDMELIEIFLRNKVQGNISKYKREYRELLFKMKQGEKNPIQGNEYLQEIHTKLLSA